MRSDRRWLRLLIAPVAISLIATVSAIVFHRPRHHGVLSTGPAIKIAAVSPPVLLPTTTTSTTRYIAPSTTTTLHRVVVYVPHTATTYASRGSGAALGSFYLTCYDYSSAGTTTATGTHVSTNEVAVDPNVIKMGSWIYIAGVGRRHAEDTGGAIRGHHIDVWEPSCAGFGSHYAEVYAG